MERRDKVNYYLDLAEVVAKRSTCLRRHYGAVIVKNDEVISTGYVGAPRGRQNCSDRGTCVREELQIPRGERYELCRSVHAEQNSEVQFMLSLQEDEHQCRNRESSGPGQSGRIPCSQRTGLDR